MKKVLITLVLVALLAVGWYWLKHRGAAAAPEEEAKPAAKVEVTPLKDQAIAQTIEVFGVVTSAPSADETRSVAFDSIVRKLYVAVGSTVAAGDVLLEIEPSPDARLQADSARSASNLAAKNLAATRERFDLKLATTQEVQAAEQAAEDAKLKVDSFERRGLGADGKITATQAGVVSKLEVGVGSLVTAGAPLVAISAAGQLEVKLGVEANDLAAVAAGQRVTLESSNRAELEKIEATIRLAGASLDPATGAAEVRVAVPAGAPLLLGEHVRADIELKKKDHALVVPRSAVLPDDDKHVLFTVKGGKAIRHEVQTGLVTDELIEVISDQLHAGDSVVTLGNYELEDGMATQAAEKEEKADEKKDEAKPAPEAKS
jgi:membrane fusion protein (multidrug efflux system)